jgi:formylglycine-generating enzyme required for sulfatase activity
MATTSDPDKLRSAKAVREDMVRFPETVFMLGGDIASLGNEIRDLDTAKRLGIGNVLDVTPPVWIHLDPFSIGPRMVTNAEYAEFLNYEDEEGRFYDSPELWCHVWSELGCHIETVEMPYRAADGEVQYYEETYSACTNFVEAYVQSIMYEIQYVFLGLPEERTSTSVAMDSLDDGGGGAGAKSVTRDQVLKRLFAFIKFKLRDSIAPESTDGMGALTEVERESVRGYGGTAAALEDIEFVMRELRKSYGKQVDRRLLQLFQHGQLAVESMAFLERFAAAIRGDDDADSTVPLGKVLFPRRWKSPRGEVRKRRLVGTAVPWGDVPVTGLSFFEAVAYSVWLSSITETELSLPNEAQYERASSWPVGGPPEAGKPIPANPKPKRIFPWQDHCPHDFNYFFGREGFELEGYYQKSRKTYNELMESTARRLEGDRKLYQMEGFGWHWTCDRYSPTELKYGRFKDPDYARYKGAPCLGRNRQPVEVLHYTPNRNPRDSYTVLKGSPDVIGGPGLTTRRYAAYPLRGYGNVGFRLVAKDS